MNIERKSSVTWRNGGASCQNEFHFLLNLLGLFAIQVREHLKRQDQGISLKNYDHLSSISQLSFVES